MHTHNNLAIRPAPHDGVGRRFFEHSSAQRINTDSVIVEALRTEYPNLKLTIIPAYECDLLGYAAIGHARAVPIEGDDHRFSSIKWRYYAPPGRRLDGGSGSLYDVPIFAKYLYTWKEEEFILYLVQGANSTGYAVRNFYLLGPSEASMNALVLEASTYANELHNEVLLFDGGYWQKSAALWQSVQNSSWDDVILDPAMKTSITGDLERFYAAREKYAKFKVPWKRGIIFWGPPGNGKTISIKSIMHSLSDRPDPIPTLYVRSLSSWAGPENSISQIFGRARRTAPCFLVFEDLDSIITDSVRSYFLNAVDGLENNDGILMVGSTNHLERLDPGISKRPSRFDRKYFFPDPSMQERVEYCEYWRNRLSDNGDMEFPHELCKAIASITKGFSFAYLQESFVAALLAIAAHDDGENSLAIPEVIESKKVGNYETICSEDDKDLDRYILWREIKKAIKTLREEMDEKKSLQ